MDSSRKRLTNKIKTLSTENEALREKLLVFGNPDELLKAKGVTVPINGSPARVKSTTILASKLARERKRRTELEFELRDKDRALRKTRKIDRLSPGKSPPTHAGPAYPAYPSPS